MLDALTEKQHRSELHCGVWIGCDRRTSCAASRAIARVGAPLHDESKLFSTRRDFSLPSRRVRYTRGSMSQLASDCLSQRSSLLSLGVDRDGDVSAAHWLCSSSPRPRQMAEADSNRRLGAVKMMGRFSKQTEIDRAQLRPPFFPENMTAVMALPARSHHMDRRRFAFLRSLSGSLSSIALSSPLRSGQGAALHYDSDRSCDAAPLTLTAERSAVFANL